MAEVIALLGDDPLPDALTWLFANLRSSLVSNHGPLRRGIHNMAAYFP